jgi:hypothetical protein
MKLAAALSIILLLACSSAMAAKGGLPDEYRQLTDVKSVPVALDSSFEFRKTKLFFLGDAPAGKGNKFTRGIARDPAVGFEASYRLYGAVTALDQRRRYGHYFDFFWRGKKDVPVTVRLEYRQEKLRAFTQAREVSLGSARGSHKTSFAVVGDDFFNDGRILSWRCLLIASGHVVAEDRSFLWR